jgi:hypothetical protein
LHSMGSAVNKKKKKKKGRKLNVFAEEEVG